MKNKKLPIRTGLVFSCVLAGLLAPATRAAADGDAPAIVKDSIHVTAFTLNSYKKSFDTWSWVPKLEFRVNGPVASGSQLYADFSMPGGGSWAKFDCKTPETPKGHSLKTECGARDLPDDKGSTYTGIVNFAIKMRNELSGAADVTLFTGKIKVDKVRSNEHGPKVANHFVYYVDQDWNLPIGYVFLTPDDSGGWNLPTLHVAFWVRGDASGFEPHVYAQGKEVGKKFFGSDEVGRAICDPEVELATTQFVDDSLPQKAKWTRVHCSFPNVRGWDKTGQGPGAFGPPFLLSANPGDYEVKVLWHNHLARSLKFTAGSDGKFDNGIATSNKVGSSRVIVPVQIMGDQDGAWDRAAWRTSAFYGNPLTGFTAAP